MDYEAVVKDTMDHVYKTAVMFSNNVQDAQDAVQNTYMKLLQKNTEFTDKEHLLRWLLRVTINDCKDRNASYWNKQVVSLDALEIELEGASREEEQLLTEVMRLTPKYRIVIYLYYYEGYSVKEISQSLHISQSNVKLRLMRARGKLKTMLEAAFGLT